MYQSVQPKRQSVQPHSARHCRDKDSPLDRELVASSPTTGAPDFRQRQKRLGTRPPPLLARVPVSYVVFNLLYLDDQPTTALPYSNAAGSSPSCVSPTLSCPAF